MGIGTLLLKQMTRSSLVALKLLIAQSVHTPPNMGLDANNNDNS
jgi:hypothetical protein